MTIRVLVNGAFGQMGQMTTQALLAHGGFSLVGETGRTHHLGTAIKDSAAEVVIDFTCADAVFTNTRTILLAGARPVIGTSGLTLTEVQTLQALCAEQKLGGIIAPNFSLGAVLMIKYAAAIVKNMPHVAIVEMHHDAKPDSPSGTAIYSAEMLQAACKTVNEPLSTTHETIAHARGAMHKQVPIHSVRLPGVLANQQIIFGNTGETLTLAHSSISRDCFMPGVLHATEKVMALDRLIYGLENIL
ncbi:MAG: 4-hydroxy-tetrahydrodipicolinate reductase [Gammaproteobacteria bacterium RIFCSPHIGHO2_12_FULL_42_10]|nr:MAG: 4-hydroxy-tetrahydrodipicolinate reductase [Gammaproteobacteria bacterium RIFCSPHIGHO2_12_FULL_42_10]